MVNRRTRTVVKSAVALVVERNAVDLDNVAVVAVGDADVELGVGDDGVVDDCSQTKIETTKTAYSLHLPPTQTRNCFVLSSNCLLQHDCL